MDGVSLGRWMMASSVPVGENFKISPPVPRRGRIQADIKTAVGFPRACPGRRRCEDWTAELRQNAPSIRHDHDPGPPRSPAYTSPVVDHQLVDPAQHRAARGRPPQREERAAEVLGRAERAVALAQGGVERGWRLNRAKTTVGAADHDTIGPPAGDRDSLEYDLGAFARPQWRSRSGCLKGHAPQPIPASSRHWSGPA